MADQFRKDERKDRVALAIDVFAALEEFVPNPIGQEFLQNLSTEPGIYVTLVPLPSFLRCRRFCSCKSTQLQQE